MGCEGCFSSEKAINEALNQIKNEAKKFAIEKQTNVFIYFDETRQPKYMAEEAARQIGIQPTGGTVSYMQPMSA